MRLIKRLIRAQNATLQNLRRLTREIDRLSRQLQELEKERAQAVMQARALEITWQSIGKAVGMSPQGAHQRWWPKGSSPSEQKLGTLQKIERVTEPGVLRTSVRELEGQSPLPENRDSES